MALCHSPHKPNGLSGKTAPYGTEPPSWVKIKNPDYSQAKDRRQRFEHMRARRAAVTYSLRLSKE